MASLIQLGAVGGQDVDILVRPERTFFRGRYKRHTPFAMEPRDIPFTTQNPQWGTTNTITISRNADLLAKLYLVMDVQLHASASGTPAFNDAANLAYHLFEYITLEAGSVVYDTIYPEYAWAWKQLTETKSKALTNAQKAPEANQKRRIYVPLEFYFQNDYTKALPLISLHLTDVKVNVRLRKSDELVSAGSATVSNARLVGEYIWLDDSERELFARTQHKFLITQIQRNRHIIAENEKDFSKQLNFNHPTKELMFLVRDSGKLNEMDFNSVEKKGDYPGHAMKELSLFLNNNARLQAVDPLYMSVIQPHMHHSAIPSDKGIYTYSFALEPEKSVPTGSLNFSRIENTKVSMKRDVTAASELLVFARSINVVKVFAGIASLRWSS